MSKRYRHEIPAAEPITDFQGIHLVNISLRYQHKGIYVTPVGYQITQQNMMTPDPAGTLCGTSTCLVQTGEGRVRGIELEAKASLPFGLAVIGTTTRTFTTCRNAAPSALPLGDIGPIRPPKSCLLKRGLAPFPAVIPPDG